MSNATTMLELAGVDNASVRIDQSDSGGLHFVHVVGGGGAAANHTGTQGLTLFGGAAAGYVDAVTVANWGKALLEEIDFEGGSQGSMLDGAGYLTQVGGRLSTYDSWCGFNQGSHLALPALPNSVGTAQMLGAATYANIALNSGLFFDAASSASFLGLGAFDDGRSLPSCASPLEPPAPTTTTSPVVCNGPTPVTAATPGQYVSLAATPATGNSHMLLASGEIDSAFLTCNDVCNPSTSTCNNTTEAAFVTTMLADLRAASVAPPTACGQTDVR